MGRFQIAQGSGAGHAVTITVEAATDPGLDIALRIKEINRIGGLNKREIPAGHLPNEYQLTIIDINNELFLALENNADDYYGVQISYNGATILDGRFELANTDFPYTKSTNVFTLMCDDGFLNLKKFNIGTTYQCRGKEKISDLFTTMLQQTASGNLDVRMAMGLDYPAASGTAIPVKLRIVVEALVRDLDTPTYYDVLLRFCKDFELVLFQEDGVWYILDIHSRAGGITEVYNCTTAAVETVDFSRILDNSSQRSEPIRIELEEPGQVKTVNEVLVPNNDIRNPGFEEWDPNNDYPLEWCYENLANFEKNSNGGVHALQQGDLLHQWLLMSSGRNSWLNLNFDISVRFGPDSDTGSITVTVGRLRAFNQGNIYGYDQANNVFSTSSDGWLTISREYPQSTSETKWLELPDEVLVSQHSTILLELLFDSTQDISGALIERNPDYSNAGVELQDPVQDMNHTAYAGTAKPVFDRKTYLSDYRRSYVLGDIEYFDGVDWLPTEAGWGIAGDTNYRVYEFTRLGRDIWGHGPRIFDVPVVKTQRFNLYEEIEITVNGQPVNCVPIRIRSAVKGLDQNELRLLECVEKTSTTPIETINE